MLKHNLHIIFSYSCILSVAFFYPEVLFSQKKSETDSVFFLSNKNGLIGKIGKSIYINPLINNDSAHTEIRRNAAEYELFRNKIIRKIHFQPIELAATLKDTSNKLKTFINLMSNALHTQTKEKIIRNNLFFNEGDLVYPSLIADNEKYLRDLSFLQDAEIIVETIPFISDSVDVFVLTKDIFPIGGSIKEASSDMIDFELNDDNLLGSGNKIQLQHFFDIKRFPVYGIGAYFLQRNIAGTFLDVSAGFQNQKPAFNSGRKETKSFFIKGNLPLVSPYHTITGGFDISSESNDNTYMTDSVFYKLYAYDLQNIDAWIGFNLGAKKQLSLNLKSRFKKVLSMRVLHRNFLTVPMIYYTNYDSRYTDLNGFITSYTLFEQDFYHTNFIYGFGRNEDVPEGFNLSFTTGWTNQNGYSRIYTGFEYQRNYFNNKMTYLNYSVKAGGFFNKQRVEDISFLSSLELFTKLKKLGKGHWYNRHFLSGSISQQIYTFLNDPVRLSSIYGLPLYRNPEKRSSGRFTLNAETVFYNTWKFYGFSFAPFSFCNLSFLKDLGRNSVNGELYTALGGGVRTRNENLVFGTMELKAYYFTKTIAGMNPWNITFSTDLKFRYITQLIRKPDVIELN